MPGRSGGIVFPTWFPDIVTCGASCGATAGRRCRGNARFTTLASIATGTCPRVNDDTRRCASACPATGCRHGKLGLQRSSRRVWGRSSRPGRCGRHQQSAGCRGWLACECPERAEPLMAEFLAFRDSFAALPSGSLAVDVVRTPEFCLYEDRRIAAYYAPFDYLNREQLFQGARADLMSQVRRLSSMWRHQALGARIPGAGRRAAFPCPTVAQPQARPCLPGKTPGLLP
jgi:hypothetical protein